MKLLTNLNATLLALLMMLTGLAACSSDDDGYDSNEPSTNQNANDTSTEPALQRLEFPKVKGGSSVVLIHTTNDQWGINYSVEWDCEKKSQRWSCYQVTAKTCEQHTSRYYGDPQYPYDPELSSELYLSQDCFWSSGFDHGHICPSGDRLYSYDANYQTFFLTNMQPQYKAFNGSLSGSEAYKNQWSPWYRLESQIRSWAKVSTTETLYVVKGGTIEDDQVMKQGNQTWLLRGEMRIPKYFFVALLMKNKEGYKAAGFWMEHKGSYSEKQALSSYAVNVRELEKKTGIDFFCNLPDDIEEHVETLPVANVIKSWSLDKY